MKQRKISVMGLDISSSSLKLVEYSHKTKQVLTVAKMFPTPEEYQNPDKLRDVIHQWILDNKQSESIELATSVPLERSFVHFSAAKSKQERHPTKGLADIEWEMEQYLGVDLEQDPYNWNLAPVIPNKKISPLLTAACRKEEVEYLKKLLDFPDFPLTVMDIDILSAINAFEANYPERLSQEQLLIRADLHSWSLLLVKKGQLQHYQHIPCTPNEDGSYNHEVIPETHVEAVAQYLRSPVCADTKPTLVLLGEHASNFEFHEVLMEHCTLPMEILNPFRKISFPHDKSMRDKVAQTGPQCAIALGLALRQGGDSR